MLQYFLIHKPFNVLCQFSPSENKRTLKDVFNVPPDVYPVGRLDYDSEGLLILTNDKSLNKLLLDPIYKHQREYWVQVEGAPTPESIKKLSEGIFINIDGKKHLTKKCIASFFSTIPQINSRIPPIRIRKTIPDTWIKLVLSEGKNRQVRKMTAAIGHPTLRLIRYAIENATIDSLQPAQMIELSKQEMYNLLNIKS